MGNSFARRVATESRLLRRSCESLLGLYSGLLADGELNDAEIRFLDVWLAEHSEIATTWPGEAIAAKVREIAKHKKISEEEREHLKSIMADTIGGTLQETGATSGVATKLPLDHVDKIEIKGRSFCFTGEFHYGTRKFCETAVESRGGLAASSIVVDLDYLVIGTLVSHDWAHTSFGRKIEKAMDYKSKGRSISIVSEEQWIQSL